MARPRKPVFINCPFDAEYKPLFQAIVFAVLKCGFQPRFALEVVDSGGTRIAKIETLIDGQGVVLSSVP